MSKSELTSIVKKCCDILRTDDGISGAVHYTEVLSWILYLKFFADKEKERADLHELEGKKYTPLIKKEFQWENWTDQKKGLTGKELNDFINNELFPYLASLEGTKEGDPRDIVSAIFKNSNNRVNSGYLLRDVIEEIKKIHFELGDDMFTLSHIYEDLLKGMGEGGGNSGEFYTPRPLVRSMVKLLDPKIGETLYDPACGTGGFLAEAHLHMVGKVKTPDDRRILNNKTFFGQEKTPLPFVMCLMNLTLHGMDYPQIVKGNTLSRNIRDIEDHEKHDVIVANPPFGGKEQKMIQKNFIIEANATELLFLQHMEKTLKVNGRAGVIVPEGVLFQTNSAYKQFKEKLIKDCNVHSVVSLPAGVFLPYSAVKTSVIFFDKKKKTKDVWFYEVPLIDEKKLTKKNGITEKHFLELLKLYKKREETERSWLVPVEKVLESGTNLSASHYNPHGIEAEDLLEPEQYAEEIKELLQSSLKNIDELIWELK
ncbi:MAG: type I restriction enzyme M protein [Bacteriovoracaceae bacterium]